MQKYLLLALTGGIFMAIFVVILSLYTYKFYESRSETSYHNL